MKPIICLLCLIGGLLAPVSSAKGQTSPPTMSDYERDSSGWTDLMPQPGLSGWTKIPIPASGQLQGKEQWAIRDGALIIDGTGGHEWLRYDAKRFKNFIFRAEWRFKKLEGTPRYNGGLYFWANADGSQFYQAQTGEAGGWLFGGFLQDGKSTRINLREKMFANRMAPVGEWNTFEVKATASQIDLWVNGAVQSRWEKPPVTEGYLGLEAEGFFMEFRRLMVKELP